MYKNASKRDTCNCHVIERVHQDPWVYCPLLSTLGIVHATSPFLFATSWHRCDSTCSFLHGNQKLSCIVLASYTTQKFCSFSRWKSIRLVIIAVWHRSSINPKFWMVERKWKKPFFSSLILKIAGNFMSAAVMNANESKRRTLLCISTHTILLPCMRGSFTFFVHTCFSLASKNCQIPNLKIKCTTTMSDQNSSFILSLSQPLHYFI